jgi:acyl-CoA thioester hydrolase
MSKFKFHYPIEVRFGDLDAYWHGNNAGFLVYLEQARSQYMLEMGLYDGKDLGKLPLIVGDIHCGYHFPIELGDKVVVSLGTTRISHHTVAFEYEITARTELPCTPAPNPPWSPRITLRRNPSPSPLNCGAGFRNGKVVNCRENDCPYANRAGNGYFSQFPIHLSRLADRHPQWGMAYLLN